MLTLESIRKENWRKAKGIKGRTSKRNTNSGLTPRDYDVECDLKEIICVNGFHIWWCSNHYQPYHYCQNSIKHERIKAKVAKAME